MNSDESQISVFYYDVYIVPWIPLCKTNIFYQRVFSVKFKKKILPNEIPIRYQRFLFYRGLPFALKRNNFFVTYSNGLFVFVSLEETYPPMTNIWINVYNAIWSLRLIRRSSLRSFQILSLKRRRRWDNSCVVCAPITPQRIAEQRDLNNGIENNKSMCTTTCILFFALLTSRRYFSKNNHRS